MEAKRKWWEPWRARLRSRSVANLVVAVPLLIHLFLFALLFASCALWLSDMQRMTDRQQRNILQSSMNNLEAGLNQFENQFAQYINTSKDYLLMSRLGSEARVEDYFLYMMNTRQRLDEISNSYLCQKGGTYARFDNLDLSLFSGSANVAVHRYIQDHVTERGADYNHWDLIWIDDRCWLMYFQRYGDFYGGVWLDPDWVVSSASLVELMPGSEQFLRDTHGASSSSDPELRTLLAGMPDLTGEQGLQLGKEVVWLLPTDNNGLSLCLMSPKEKQLNVLPLHVKIVFALAVLAFLTIPFLVIWMRRRIARRVSVLDEAMAEVGGGNRNYRIPLPEREGEDEFDRLMRGFNQMLDRINLLEIDLYKTKFREQRTQFKYISQQIRPHFILNALNIVYSYDVSEFDQLKQMVLYLTDYFRYVTYLREDYVAVEQEMRHTKTYLKIQRERYGEGFDFYVEWSREVSLCRIPPLILQTFVENCIKYGRGEDNQCFILVTAAREGERLKLTVADSGQGFPAERLAMIQDFLNNRTYHDELGVGIQNAIERLDLLYGDEALVRVENAETGGARVEITLPMNIKEAGENDV